MTRIEYDLICKDHPELELTDWSLLWEPGRILIRKESRERFIRKRSFYLMSTTAEEREEKYNSEFWAFW